MLYLIGLGLCNEKDISLRAIESLKNCDEIYCETYTNFYHGNLNVLEEMTGKKIKILDRNAIEEGKILFKKDKNVALLVPGDPLTATTHISLILECKKRNIKTKIIHSSSIWTAIAETGLSLYKFGRPSTLPFPYKESIPESPYSIILENFKRNLHTLVLLDIDRENGRFLSINEGIKILIEIEKKRKERKEETFLEKAKIVCCARIGSENQIIKKFEGSEIEKNPMLLNFDFGNPPQCLVIASKLHFIEEEFLNTLD